MGLLQALTGTSSNRRVQFLQNGNVILSIDVSIKETHSSKAPATEFEVESGQNISDFQILKPFSLTMTGIITDTPIAQVAPLLAAIGSLPGVPAAAVQAAGTALNVINNASALFSAISGAQAPSLAAYLQLIQIQNQRQPVEVVTTLNAPFQQNPQLPALYKNMWIEEITVPRDADTGQCLLFDVSLKQLRLVSPSTVSIALLSNPDVSLQQALKNSQSLQNLNGFNLGFQDGQVTSDNARLAH